MKSIQLGNKYLTNLEKMINSLRSGFNDPEMPAFTATLLTREKFETCDGPTSNSRPGAAGVLQAQLEVVDKITHLVIFSHGALPYRHYQTFSEPVSAAPTAAAAASHSVIFFFIL